MRFWLFDGISVAGLAVESICFIGGWVCVFAWAALFSTEPWQTGNIYVFCFVDSSFLCVFHTKIQTCRIIDSSVFAIHCEKSHPRRNIYVVRFVDSSFARIKLPVNKKVWNSWLSIKRLLFKVRAPRRGTGGGFLPPMGCPSHISPWGHICICGGRCWPTSSRGQPLRRRGTVPWARRTLLSGMMLPTGS